MKKILIPFKNLIFDNEILFIEKKYNEGFRLKKRGMFFYYFEKAKPSRVVCEIDLVDKNFCNTQIDGWQKTAIKKTKYKRLFKVYYISNNINARLLTDISNEFEYYKYYQQLFLTLSMCAILPLLLSLFLLFVSISLPIIILYLSILLIIPFVYFIRNHNTCEKAVCNMCASQGRLTGFEAHYLLTFKNLTIAEMDNLMTNLSNFGAIKKINDDCFRIQSPLAKEELYKEIPSILAINESNINIMHIGELFFN